MPREFRGANGEIDLFRDWHETSSGHTETTTTARLNAASATTYFNDWYKRVIHTKLKPMKAVARSIKERLQNVVSFCTHKITNAVAEGMNSKIMSIKRRVGGFRNRQNFKTAIFFYCGGLSLYPQ